MELTKHQLIEQLLGSSNFSVSLDEIQQVINQLNLKPKYPIILIGGTNGKGSVCAYLTNILTRAGYRVGSFTSPHVLDYNERISINNQAISDTKLIEVLSLVIAASYACLNKNLNMFAAFTIAAHLVFTQVQVDIAIVEVGLGGRLDPTNLFEPMLSAITNVDYDHCAILGNTRDAIGLEKAGIFRKDKWCLFGSSQIPDSVVSYAKKIGAKLNVAGTDFGATLQELSFDIWCSNRIFFTLPYPVHRGVAQVENAALALAILNKISDRFVVSLSNIKTGLLQGGTLIGRFQVLPGLPQVVLDVAHNPQAVSNMIRNMLKLPFAKNEYAVFALANDKDMVGIIKQCQNKFNKWFIAPINSSRSTSIEQILAGLIAHGITQDSIIPSESIAKAYEKALAIAKNDDRITCFGSFLVVEEVYIAIHKRNKC